MESSNAVARASTVDPFSITVAPGHVAVECVGGTTMGRAPPRHDMAALSRDVQPTAMSTTATTNRVTAALHGNRLVSPIPRPGSPGPYRGSTLDVTA